MMAGQHKASDQKVPVTESAGTLSFHRCSERKERRVGAESQGIRTGEPWRHNEEDLHINVLELIAAELGFKSFTKGPGFLG